jgi:hypothetical protein
MKKELTIICNETRFAANRCLDDCKITERLLLKLFHELLLPPEDCTKDMVANIATILMDENFPDVYLKYAN